MPDMHDLIKENDCADMHCIVDNGSSKYVCFTKQDADKFTVNASDGLDLWNIKLDFDDLDAHRDLSGINMEAYLSKLRSGFKSGAVQVSQIGVKLTLSVGAGSNPLMFDLYETKALERKTEVQGLLFRLAEKSIDLENKLAKVEKDVKQLKSGKDGSASAMDMAGKSAKAQAKAAVPKQAGMSALNPGSKKRKTAKGVSYD